MKKRMVTVVLWLLCAGLMTVNALASGGGAPSDNLEDQNYSVWSAPVNSYLTENDDGSFTRVEKLDKTLIAEQYDCHKVYVSRIELPMELSAFGGYYSGQAYNFLVFGRDNPSEDNRAEVFRVVKYSKSWERLGQASLSNCNTTAPFVAGSLRMAEDDNVLYLRTAHQMYQTEDGLHHQANITVSVDIPNMKILEANSDISNLYTGYVSHSFNQFILAANGQLATLDHGDAYPRSFTLITYEKTRDHLLKVAQFTDLLTFAGGIGANSTDASVGGFEASDDTYLTVGNSTRQNRVDEETRNIFLCVNAADDLTRSQFKWLTHYQENGKNCVSTPQLVKINNSRFLILWYESDHQALRYLLADQYGNLLSDIQSMDAKLSDCQPIASGNKVIWYTTNQSAPVFYEIHTNTIPATAVLTSVNMKIDGKPIRIQAYNINGSNHFRLRDLEYVTMAYGDKPFRADWNPEENRITLETDIEYQMDEQYLTDSVYIDGDAKCKAYLTASSVFLYDTPIDVLAYLINDSNYFKLRDLCEQLNYEVGWDQGTNTITLNT